MNFISAASSRKKRARDLRTDPTTWGGSLLRGRKSGPHYVGRKLGPDATRGPDNNKGYALLASPEKKRLTGVSNFPLAGASALRGGARVTLVAR